MSSSRLRVLYRSFRLAAFVSAYEEDDLRRCLPRRLGASYSPMASYATIVAVRLVGTTHLPMEIRHAR